MICLETGVLCSLVPKAGSSEGVSGYSFKDYIT